MVRGCPCVARTFSSAMPLRSTGCLRSFLRVSASTQTTGGRRFNVCLLTLMKPACWSRWAVSMPKRSAVAAVAPGQRGCETIATRPPGRTAPRSSLSRVSGSGHIPKLLTTSTSRPDRPARHPWAASADPGRPPVGDRAYPCLGQPGRQAALVHRTPPARRRVLVAAGLGPHCGGRLIRRAWTHYRWEGRPRRRRPARRRWPDPRRAAPRTAPAALRSAGPPPGRARSLPQAAGCSNKRSRSSRVAPAVVGSWRSRRCYGGGGEAGKARQAV
jgi:hypothetical protein